MWCQTRDQTEEISFPICNQYTIQGDLFSEAILNDTDVPTPLEDAVANMKVIEAVVQSAKIQSWI
jgi:predicted dehydrogenase